MLIINLFEKINDSLSISNNESLFSTPNHYSFFYLKLEYFKNIIYEITLFLFKYKYKYKYKIIINKNRLKT